MSSSVGSKASEASLKVAVMEMEKGETFEQREEHPVFDRGFAAWATLIGGSVIVVLCIIRFSLTGATIDSSLALVRSVMQTPLESTRICTPALGHRHRRTSVG
jgi:hypothetical protein